MRLLDMYPTLLKLSGAEKSAELDGTDFTEVLINNGELPPRDIFWRYGKNKAVRSGKWKLVVSGESAELFNLDSDFEERNNLAEQNPETVNELLEKIKSWEEDVLNGVTILTN